MEQPIMEFENIEQAQKCLAEWQDRLFLQDWIIKIAFANSGEIEGVGEISMVASIKNAVIKIMPQDKRNVICGTTQKYCAEKTLVHELLHIKLDRSYSVPANGNCSVETNTFEEVQHQTVEQMAKSLIMAKYNLTFDWFKNF